jgi:hypothetical protein
MRPWVAEIGNWPDFGPRGAATPQADRRRDAPRAATNVAGDGALPATSRRVRLGGEPRSPWPIGRIGDSPHCHIRRRCALISGMVASKSAPVRLLKNMPVEKGFPAADPAESPSRTCRRHDRPQRDQVGVDFGGRGGEPVLLSGDARPTNALWLLPALRRPPNSSTCQTRAL